MVYITQEHADALIAVAINTIKSYMFKSIESNATEEDIEIHKYTLKEPIEETLDTIAKNLNDEIKYFKF